MAEIRFNIPDGDSCKDCPHQENFDIAEVETTCLEDAYPKYLRHIIANCHLFNEQIRGTTITEMEKCQSCMMKSKEDNTHGKE